MFDEIEFIDLTHVLDEKVPTWSGSCGFKHEIKRDYDTNIRVMKYQMHASAGTHMDAPSHFFQGGKCVADYSISDLIAKAYVLDLSSRCSETLSVTKEDILRFESRVGKIASDSFFIAYTGWQKYWGVREKYRNLQPSGLMLYPTISKEAAALLCERNVCGVGIDTFSPDGADEENPVHHLLLGRGKIILENLCNLEKMPEVGGYIFALPLNVKMGSEAPVRCIGAIKKSQ